MSTARADLKSTISADTTQFAAGMRRAGMIAKNTGSAIGKGLSSATRSMASLGASAAKSAAMIAKVNVAIGAGAIAAGAFQGIKLAANMETLGVAFRTLVGDADLAAKTLDQLKELGASTPFEFPELANAGRSLIAFGISAENVAETLRMVGDVSAGVDAPIGEIAEIFGKAKVAGTLFADDINQLVGRGIPVIQEFAKQLGVSEGEVKKLASEGKITFPMLQKAFVDLTSDGGKFYEMMKAQSGTTAGLFSTLKDEINSALTEFGKPINDALRPMLEKAIAMSSSIKDVAAGIGQALGDALSGAPSGLEKIQAALVATFVFATVAFSEGLVKAFELAYKFFNALFSPEGLAFLGVTLEEVMFSAFEAAGKFLSDILTLGIEKAQALWNGEPLFDDTGKDLAETASEFAARLKDELSDIDAGPSDALKAAAAQYAEMIKSLFPKVEGSGGSGGSTSEADEYDKELEEQRKRVAADAAAMAAAAPIEQMGPPAALKMANADLQGKRNSALAGGFTGLAGLAQMQLDKGSGIGPGVNNAFAQDRERLGLKSGLSTGSLQTGGLGAKRAVGQQKADNENKKNLTLAEKQASSLENIERKIEASLTVN